jgi:hypothetical protein
VTLKEARAPARMGVAMGEEPRIIRMNIARYEAMLERDLSDERRSDVTRVLAEAKESLAAARRMGRTG